MKKVYLSILILACLFFVFACSSNAQQINAIQTKCPSPSVLNSSIRALNTGDIAYRPCAGFSSIFYGNVDFSNATIVGTGFITGTGTANFVPRFTSASAIGNTPLSWTGTSYTFLNTALNSDWRIGFTPNDTTGFFGVGNYTTAQTNFITLTESSGFANITTGGGIIGKSPVVSLGDTDGNFSGIGIMLNNTTQDIRIGDFNGLGNATLFTVNDAQETITNNANETRILNQFAVASTSDCADEATIGIGGTVTITTATCVMDETTSFVLATYNDIGVAKVLPLSTDVIDANNFTVVGDANRRVNYFVINRY